MTDLPQWHVRIGEVERNQVCDALSAHFVAGRLRADELEIRLGAAMTATTRGDLYEVLADLPSTFVPAVGAPAVQRSDNQAAAGQAAPWRVSEILGLVGAVGAVGITGLMLLGVLFGLDRGIFVLCVFGGLMAAFGGGALTYVWTARRTAGNRPTRPGSRSP